MKMKEGIEMEKKKVLVAYFSCSGITEHAAKVLAEVTGGDIYEIAPKIKYTEADLNWNDKQSRSTIEMNDHNCRPEIENKVENFQQYDGIFVGFPIWWYVEPKIIDTFLESYDFSGKTVIPFATSGGSGFGKAEENMKKLCSPKTKWCKGKILNGSLTRDSLLSWIDSLKF